MNHNHLQTEANLNIIKKYGFYLSEDMPLLRYNNSRLLLFRKIITAGCYNPIRDRATVCRVLQL
jgi:hypothetical protein